MTPDELKNHLYLLDLAPESRETIFEMALTSPARKVGAGALDNSIVRFQSIKNGHFRLLESHTVERLLALELELDPSVLAYYTQVRCTGIERNGGSHVTSGTVDFMAVKTRSVALIEAKPRSKIDQLLAQRPDEWQMQGDRIVRPPYLQWALKREIDFQVWTPPHPLAVYLSNLQLIYACLSVFPEGENAVLDLAVQAIRRKPQTIEDLCNSIDRFTPELAALLIGRRLAFGPIRHALIEDMDRFMLFSDPEQVRELNHDLSQRVAESITQSKDPISQASYIDLCKGRERLAKVNAFIAENRSPPRYWAPLVRAVKEARLEGRNDLAVCLTSYASSGNTDSRLTKEQLDILNPCIVSHWNSGVSIDASDFHGHLHESCKEKGIRTPTLKTIAKHLLKKQDRKKREASSLIRSTWK